MFQSLIGFKINWNFFDKIYLDASIEFQSLIGFKINWNGTIFLWDGVPSEVSIPNRV